MFEEPYTLQNRYDRTEWQKDWTALATKRNTKFYRNYFSSFRNETCGQTADPQI